MTAMEKEDGGLYAAVFSMGRPGRIRVGALGVLDFAPGTYIYIGSARRALMRRIARHRRRIKPARWHVDYVRRKARWRGAVVFLSRRDECALAASACVTLRARVAHRRLGASDCGCPGHLLHTLAAPDEAVAALEMMAAADRVKRSGSC